SSGHVQKTAARLVWEDVAIQGALLVSLLSLLILFIRIIRIFRLKRTHENFAMQGFCLIETELQDAPFSFFANLFWKKSIDLNSEAGQLILNHELVHIRGKHTYDKLFSQALVCIFWMNPFYRIIQKELNLVHEFIADGRSIQNGDTTKFAQILLQSHNDGSYLDPAHSFFHSPIKRRLIMITNAGSSPYSYLRRVLILPITAIVLFMFSITIATAQNDTLPKTDTGKNKKYEDEKNAKLFDPYHPQGYSPTKKELREIVERIIQNPPADRVYYVNGVKTSIEKIRSLKYDRLSDVVMLPPEDAMKRKTFPEIGEKGVIAFLLK
ncbi:MAG TPA: M56 family metallopeptidase, partial [Puia sp.]|nr:M56 family metallopeptidase [Puia sp.]